MFELPLEDGEDNESNGSFCFRSQVVMSERHIDVGTNREAGLLGFSSVFTTEQFSHPLNPAPWLVLPNTNLSWSD